MAMATIPTVKFHDGETIPQVGLGVFKVGPEEVEGVVSAALEVGFRSIDTAAAYGNEEGVGRAIASSGLPREEIHVTTKLRNSDHGYDTALDAFERSLERLGLEWVDLYLIHWPVPERDRYVETWSAFEHLKDEGRARSIGVSNFRIEDLERLQSECEEQPVLNQIELHPMLVQKELRTYHEQNGIVTEAWSPLAKAAILAHPTLIEIAEDIGRTPSQVVLRWHMQLGNVAIPKTVTCARMAENLDIFSFSLSPDQMAEVTALDSETRTGPDPNTFQG